MTIRERLTWAAVVGSGALLAYLLFVPAAFGDDFVHEPGLAPGEDSCWVYELERGCEPMPAGMAPEASAVWLGCEVREWWGKYDEPGDAVGLLGERGVSQLHPRHAAAMRRAGLTFQEEGDRVKWAVRLYEWQGWWPWSCRKVIG